MATWFEQDASAHEREWYTTEQLYVLTCARRYAAMADARVAEIEAEIRQLYSELREIVRTYRERVSPLPMPIEDGRRYDEVQLRLRLLSEELIAARMIRGRARRECRATEMRADAAVTYDDTAARAAVRE